MSDDVLSRVWPEWQIEKQIGKGSFGVVYQAVRRDNNLVSYAAIKVISIPSEQSEVDSLKTEGLDENATQTYFKGIVDDFVNEIKLMESFKGIQNIVSVEDYKVVKKEEGIGWDIFIRMELLTPFNNYICNKKLDEKEIIKLGIDICTALEICGKKNIIHRDIKPENIFINEFGFFKLGDFGIARRLENMTGGLSQKGTYNYMAPEVAKGTKYDARVDIYSLGIMLYRLLNDNRLPFLDNEKQLLNPNERKKAVDRRLAGESLPVPCQASAEMANLVLRACSYDPNQRFSNATEMKQALLSVLDGSYKVDNFDSEKTMMLGDEDSSTSQDSMSNSDMKNKKKKSKKSIAIIIIVIFILLSLGGAVFISRVLPNITNSNIVNDSNNTDERYSRKDKENIKKIIENAESLAQNEKNYEAVNEIEKGLKVYPNSIELKNKLDEYNAAISKQEKKEVAAIINEADTLAASNKYEEAINKLKKGLITYPESSDLQNRLDKYNSMLIEQQKEKTLQDAKNLADNGDYIGALRLIESVQSGYGEDKDLEEARFDYENTYVNEVMEQADNLIVNGQYNDAIRLLENANNSLKDNSKITEKINYIKGMQPVLLYDVCPPYQHSNFYDEYIDGKRFSMCGDTYTNGFTFGQLENGNEWAYFNLDGKYKKLEFDVGHVDDTAMNDSVLNIYTDGTLVYTMELDADALVQHVFVDVTNARQLRIELATFDLQSWERAKYGFGNLTLNQ